MNFDDRLGALARDLLLRESKYNETAAYCHFGHQPFEQELPLRAYGTRKSRTAEGGMNGHHIFNAMCFYFLIHSLY
jgi:S-adenosylmethionine synthetase